jgi:SOS-response transcriptional repressor LexA
MSKQKKCDQKLSGRGGYRLNSGRPPGTKCGEATVPIRLPLSAIDPLQSYKVEYCEIYQKIIQSDLLEDSKDDNLDELDELDELGNFWKWLEEELSTSKKVIDIGKYRKYSAVAATPNAMGAMDYSYEDITLEDTLIKDRYNSYVLEVVGDSMTDMEIYQGTLLIVEGFSQTHKELKGGEIVVASLGSSFSMMVKVYHRDENDRVFLLSANSKHKPIAVEEHDQLIIQGLVKKVINKSALMSPSLRHQYMRLLED